MIRAYISLGSNLNNPVTQIKTALAELAIIPQCKLITHSNLYLTPPLPTVIEQPDFINAVAAIDTQLSALQLLHEFQAIEKQHHRIRLQHWGPRTLDLDFLLYGDEIIQTSELIIPHPGLTQRNFVLYPLAEITPELILPTGEKLQFFLDNYPKPTVLKN